MLSPKRYAAKHGVSYSTVMEWLRRELLRGATHTEIAGIRYYAIPANAKPPKLKRGRPKKGTTR